MAIITIDTEKDSKEQILHMIDFLNKVVGSQQYVNTPKQENTDFFGNGLPSSGPQVTSNTSANDLLNMCDDDEYNEPKAQEEEDLEEIKPSKGLTDFSQFMPY